LVLWLIIAGGIGKLAKFADGHLDLHSGRSQVNHELLAAFVTTAGGPPELVEAVRTANTALGALQLCQAAGLPLADLVADRCRTVADDILADGNPVGADIAVDIVVIDRAGAVVGRSGHPA